MWDWDPSYIAKGCTTSTSSSEPPQSLLLWDLSQYGVVPTYSMDNRAQRSHAYSVFMHHVENLESILSTCITSPLVSSFLLPRVRRVWSKQMEWALFRLSFLHVTSNLRTFVQKRREKNEKWRPGNKATWGTRLFQHPLSHIRSLALYLSMVQAIQCPDRTKLMLPVQSRPYFKLYNGSC